MHETRRSANAHRHNRQRSPVGGGGGHVPSVQAGNAPGCSPCQGEGQLLNTSSPSSSYSKAKAQGMSQRCDGEERERKRERGRGALCVQ